MNILIIAQGYPSTSSMPGPPRLFNLCAGLSRAHTLVLAVLPTTDENKRAFLEASDSSGVFTEIVELPKLGFSKNNNRSRFALEQWFRRQLHRLHLAPHFLRRHRYPAYHSSVTARIEQIRTQSNADVIYIDGLPMTQYFKGLQPHTHVVDLCDCLSWLYLQKAARAQNFKTKLALYVEAFSIAFAERKVLKQQVLTLAISEVDKRDLSRLYPNARLIVVPMGVDAEYFNFRPEAAQSPHELLFTGVMDYEPNKDAALFFAKEVLPAIRAKLPSVHFSIIGSQPDPDILSMAGTNGIHVSGAVQDIRPFLHSAGVFVCPLRMGAGIKTKLLVAMASGIPIIATSLSLLGTEAVPDEHLLIANSPEEFQAQVLRLLSDTALRERIRRNARELIEKRYSWTAQVSLLQNELCRHEEKK